MLKRESTAMLSLTDQIDAVLHAPIPFFIVLVAISGVIWGVFEWCYRAVITKTRELYDLSRLEVGHWKDAAALNTSKATEQLESLKKNEGLPPELKPLLDQVTNTTSVINSQLVELGRANTAGVTLFGPSLTLRASNADLHAPISTGFPGRDPPKRQ
jgi:hypothetical protein